ncbi:hypothetical protein JCM3775_002391 [Rhodotorula graminis]
MPLDLPSPPLPPLPSALPWPAPRTPPKDNAGVPRSRTAPSLSQLARSAMIADPHPVAGASSSSSSSSSSNSWLLATATSSDTRIVLSLLPNPPLPEHLAPYLSPDSPLTPDDKRTLFTSVYLRACSAGNADTLEWLLSLPPDPTLSTTENAAAARRFSLTAASLANADVFLSGSPRAQGKRPQEPPVTVPDTAPRRWIDLEAADDEGNTALGTCVALGHAEAVRVLVENGAKVNQADRAGWTPLHWAVQNNDVPLAAFLLNRRASPLLASHKGLTPRDLVKPGREGSAMREVLKSAWEAAVERERALRRDEGEDDEVDGAREGGGARPASRLSVAASEALSWADSKERVEEEERDKEARRRAQLGRDSAMNLEVDFELLGLGEGDTPDEDEPDEVEGIPHPFVWDRCEPDQMLVFALDELPVLFDVIISTIKPVSACKFRVIPANVLFLCARYAHYFGSDEMVDELMFGTLERIEAAVHNRPDDMLVCAFWLSNCLLFLHYLRKEPNLCAATLDYQSHFSDLVNEIFVFVIRDAERRIDRVLEAAMLEHEALAGFEDVAFEDEWASTRFVKKLTGRAKKGSMRNSTSAMSLFSDSGASTSSSIGLGPPGVGGDVGASPPRLVSASTVPVNEATPRSVTALLSSTLFILQAYEIPPAIIVQAFSQLFYWISCEVFNRLLNQRKYLCRTRAMQIRLNASTLEEWARSNRLPPKLASTHFAPLNQLLQWLQCLSSETSIDGLIGTVQSLRALNPLQLRKAVREYRYEVDENRMDEDCAQYLVQIQKQWERLRLQKEAAAAATAAASSASSSGSGAEGVGEPAPTLPGGDVVRSIDEAFADPTAYSSYAPPPTEESTGELLNSRFMLPFAVPSSPSMLVHFDAPEAFGPFAHSSAPTRPTSSDGTRTPRSSSHLSLSSISRPGLPTFSSSATVSASSFADSSTASSLAPSPSPGLPTPPPPPPHLSLPSSFAPVLPDDFFAVLDAAKAGAGLAAQPSRAAALLAAHPAGASPGGAGWGAPTPELGSGTRGAWWGGPAGVEEEEEGGEEDGAADASFETGASAVDHGEDAAARWHGGESDADDSFEAPSTVSEGEAGGEAADETPRMPSGFQP